MSAEDDNQEALRRRFEAIKADRDALLQRIAEQATAFSDAADPVSHMTEHQTDKDEQRERRWKTPAKQASTHDPQIGVS